MRQFYQVFGHLGYSQQFSDQLNDTHMEKLFCSIQYKNLLR